VPPQIIAEWRFLLCAAGAEAKHGIERTIADKCGQDRDNTYPTNPIVPIWLREQSKIEQCYTNHQPYNPIK
jgi:hypothetical protein